jgi:hypothetical protein
VAPAATPKVTLGEQVTLLKNGSLGLHYFPDEGVSVVRDGKTVRVLLAADIASYRLEGPDLANLKSATRIFGPGPRGSFDSGYAGISAVYRHANGRLYGVYHAEDHEGMPKMSNGVPGYYASIGIGESADGGVTWIKLGQIISSPKPKEFKAFDTHFFRGASLPGMVADKDGRYLYVYYVDQSFAQGTSQVCVARADLSAAPPLPGKFTKYFEGGFTEPGIGGRETHVFSVRQLDDAHALYPHPTYSAALDRYVMVFNVNRWKEPMNGLPLAQSGIYLAYSSDLVTWSEPVKLIVDYSYPILGKSLSWEATIVWDDDKSGDKGWLLYSHSPAWGQERGQTPHYFVGRRIGFER